MFDNNLILIILIGIILLIICNLNYKEGFDNNYRSLSKNNNTIQNFSKSKLINNQNVPDKELVNNLYSINLNEKQNNKLESIDLDNNKLIEKPPPLNDKYSYIDENLYYNDIKQNNITNNIKFEDDNLYKFQNEQYLLKPEFIEDKFKKVIPPENMQREKLVAKDLLPSADSKNPDWFQLPNDKFNLLEAVELEIPEIKIGIDTVAQSRKNASYDIRTAPPNPKFVVSPWSNSTIEPDYNIKPLF